MCRINLTSQRVKSPHPVVYQSLATELDFDKAILPVTKMYDRVTFQTVLIAIMVYASVKCFSKHA